MSGVTRLAFANEDGSEIPVQDQVRSCAGGAAATARSGLTAVALTHLHAQVKPITFTLPPADGGGPGRRHLLAAAGEQAACTYWSPSQNAYAQQGCIGVPNPAPPGHNLSFVPDFNATDDTSLLNAWQIEGPLVDGCCSFLLNCSDPAMANVTVPLDPMRPLSQPSIRCADVTAPNVVSGTRALRLFTGTDCQLWQANNGVNCYWNATVQAFVGSNCTSQGPTRCMCRHVRLCRRAACPHPHATSVD